MSRRDDSICKHSAGCESEHRFLTATALTTATAAAAASAVRVGGCCHTNLDAVSFVSHVVNTALNVIVDLFCCFDERFLDVRGLKKKQET